MQRLSILVPLMGDLQRFEDTLVSVLENRPERSEVVVVTNRPYEDPYDLSGEVSFVEAPLDAGLLECFACGLAASHAPLVHLIAAGVEATPGWTDAALDSFDEDDVAAVAPVVVDRLPPGEILSAGLRYTRGGAIRRLTAGRRIERFVANERLLCGPELGSAFYRREALETVAWLPNCASRSIAAVELALALWQAGYRCVQAPQCVTTATADFLAHGSAWSEGAAAERLYGRWTELPNGRRSALGHATILALEAVQAPLRPRLFGRLAGRLWARLGFGKARELPIAAYADTRPSYTVRESRAA